MANPEHIAWLLEGVESWNARRNKEEFTPDFEQTDFHSVFRDAGKLDSNRKVPLDRANFILARLTNAKFRLTSLTDSKFPFANLTNASFTHADLTDARFLGANLTGAKFMLTNLTRADLGDAILAGTAIYGSEPWKAKLYPSSNISPEQCQSGQIHIESIEDLLTEVRKLSDFHTDSPLYFRGESQCGWDLRPSVMRDGFVTSERDMLVDLVSRRPEEFNGMTSALGQWVLAQHHGLRTRFLDITKNPLVALFHACQERKTEDGRIYIFAAPKSLIKPFISDTVSVISNFARLSQHHQEAVLGKRSCSCHESTNFENEISLTGYTEAMRRLYQLIRQEKPYFDERIDPRDLYRVFIVEPQKSSERIRAQSGAFLASAFHKRFERDKILKCNDDIPVYAHYQLKIPADSKEAILNDLALLNVTRETLFPGLDESAKAVIESHRQQQVT